LSDHWLDRLSVRLTRRQAMKAGLAGAMIGGLPLAHPPAAGATTGSASLPCFKGCVWTAGNDFQNSFRGCAANFVVGHTSYLIGPAYGLFASASAFACKDLAIMRQKASFYDCVQPDCGGFNPKARGGPCDDCHNNCCPCGASDNGYICCVFDCNDPSNSCCPGGAGE
jgi:hypothetical protein